MPEIIPLIQKAEMAYQALLARYKEETAGTVSELRDGGYPATAARIIKPCKDLLENWERFVLHHAETPLSSEQLDWVCGITDTMEKYLHVVLDECFIQESKQEEEQLRKEVRNLITLIRQHIQANRHNSIPKNDIEHFAELEACQRMETFGGLENLKIRLHVFQKTHFS